MLIRFRVQNFLSFKDQVELSMIPGKTRQHATHIFAGGPGRHDTRILRGAVIYGANASGKSNLVGALSFVKKLVVEGVSVRKPIPVSPFKLDKPHASQPSKFEVEFRHHERDFLYGFEVDAQRVHAEWLYELKKTIEVVLFERRNANGEGSTVEFGSSLHLESKREREFLEFVAQGTPQNQLFLTESIERNVKYFTDVYEWFRDVLTVIFPGTRFGLNLDPAADDLASLVGYLEKFGTGVCGFDLLPMSTTEGEIPSEIIEEFAKEAEPEKSIGLVISSEGDRYQLRKGPDQKVAISKLVLKHKMGDCADEVAMELGEESDGTIRLIDLIPILLSKRPKVFVVDELDRSLHPMLCYQLIDLFLKQPDASSQIIVTTHESNLLTFDLLRRDEIWFVEKDAEGASKVYSLEEFTPRYDKDIQRGYLLGRFGGIPIIAKKSFWEK